MKNIYEVQSANKRQTLLIMVIFTVFMGLVFWVFSLALSSFLGYRPGGLGFVGIAVIASGLTSLGGYWFSDKIVLASSGARALRKGEYPHLTQIVENLCMGSGIPRPALYVIDDTAPNAFATGRDPKHGVVCVTTGLCEKLNRTELEAVVAHELGHIRSYDIRTMSVVSVLVGSVALIADWFLRMSFWGGGSRDKDSGSAGAIFFVLGIVFALLSPLVASLLKLAISRRREFAADAAAVSITRQPSGLISALKKISLDQEPLEAANKATAPLYIANPFKEGDRRAVSWFSNLFNTHPPVSERIKALNKMV